MSVTLKHPSGSTPGCNSDITLNVSRVDYTIQNDIIHNRTGTEEGRAYQVTAGQIQMIITGVCIEEGGNTAMENAEVLECVANTWNAVAETGDITTYPQVNWRLNDEYMSVQKVTFIDEGSTDVDEILYTMTLFIDTRVP